MKVGEQIEGICADCGKPCLIRDMYIVRGSIWMESGMGNWDAGFLHLECLEKRLGRNLMPENDLLVWTTGETKNSVQMECAPEYLDSSEYLHHS